MFRIPQEMFHISHFLRNFIWMQLIEFSIPAKEIFLSEYPLWIVFLIIFFKSTTFSILFIWIVIVMVLHSRYDANDRIKTRIIYRQHHFFNQIWQFFFLLLGMTLSNKKFDFPEIRNTRRNWLSNARNWRITAINFSIETYEWFIQRFIIFKPYRWKLRRKWKQKWYVSSWWILDIHTSKKWNGSKAIWHSLMKYTLPESNAYACQHQNVLFERSLATKLSNTPKMIFISHLQLLQISNKAKFHAFFEKFSHLKLKPAPTQDKFLDFLQNEFSHSKCFQKAYFFSLEWRAQHGHVQTDWCTSNITETMVARTIFLAIATPRFASIAVIIFTTPNMAVIQLKK